MPFEIRFLVAAIVLGASLGCGHSSASSGHGSLPPDTAFASMQQRGQMAMGVDQTTSTHMFDALPDGGRIELLRNDAADTVGIAQIRAHLRLIQHAFQAGDFSTPQFVHMQAMPGTAEMAQKRDVIEYRYNELPRGGEVLMKTSDAGALTAIHAFMSAQRSGHHASGEGTP